MSSPLDLPSPFRVFIPIGLSLLAAGCNSQAQQNAKAPPPPTVEIVVVQPANAEIVSEFPAQTYARNLVEVRGRVAGYVERWLFRPGQQVKEGQALYTLDLRPYQAQVQQAQGTLKQAEADLLFARQQVSLLEAQAQLEASKANLVRAQQDFNRLKPLVEQDAASRQDLDAATAALRAAEANVRAGEANVRQVTLNTKTQITAAEGKLQTQRGTVTTANLNVQYGTIRAPISGVAGDTQVPVGGLVNPNSEQPLTTIVPLDPMWVRFKLSEAQYLQHAQIRGGSNRSGPALELYLADGTKFPYAGRIENALNQVDSRTGTLEVQARFANPQGVVLPGQFGQVRFITDRRQNALMVPQRAVLQNQNLQIVYTVGNGDKIEARAVKPGPRVGDDWIIDGGLKAGDRVVVEGLLSVRPGVVVRPTPYKDEAAGGQATKGI